MSSPRERLHPTKVRKPIPVFGHRSWAAIAHVWFSIFLFIVGAFLVFSVGAIFVRLTGDGLAPSSIDAYWNPLEEGDVLEQSDLLVPHGDNDVIVRVKAADAPRLAALLIFRGMFFISMIICALVAMYRISQGFASAAVFSLRGGLWLRRFAAFFIAIPFLLLTTAGQIEELERAYVRHLDQTVDVQLYVIGASSGGDFLLIPEAVIIFLFFTFGGTFFFLLGTALIRGARMERLAQETV